MYIRGSKPRFGRLLCRVFSALLLNDNKGSLLASKPQDFENDSSQQRKKPPQSSLIFHQISQCRPHITIRQWGVGQSWKLNSYSSPLRSTPYGILQTSPCLLLTKGFVLALHDCSPAPKSLFKTVLAVHFTPAAICHSLCRSCDVILRFVSDIRMSWWPSRSVESRFHPLLVCSFVVVPNVCSLTLFLWQAILAGHLESARVAVALVSTVVEQ